MSLFNSKREFKDEMTMIWYRIGMILIPVLFFFIVLFVVKGESIVSGESFCGFLKLTSLKCPGCGGTRAFYELIHFHILGSIKQNPGVLVTFLLYLFFMINTAFRRHTKKAGFTAFPVTIAILADVAFLFAQCVLRNIFHY
jgi:hypothetical protein